MKSSPNSSKFLSFLSLFKLKNVDLTALAAIFFIFGRITSYRFKFLPLAGKVSRYR